MSAGDAQPDPGQAAGDQAAEELPPERLGLGLADIKATSGPAGSYTTLRDFTWPTGHRTELFDPEKVSTTRYLYRGSVIPSPWPAA